MFKVFYDEIVKTLSPKFSVKLKKEFIFATD